MYYTVGEVKIIKNSKIFSTKFLLLTFFVVLIPSSAHSKIQDFELTQLKRDFKKE